MTLSLPNALLLAALLPTAGCNLPPLPPPYLAPKDIGRRAYDHVSKLVAMGPRHTGSLGWHLSIAYIKQEIEKLGLQYHRDRWTDPDENLTFENIWVTFKGRSDDRILLACHHDTKKCTGHDDPDYNFHFVGANDSGSGVGLLLALAKELKKRKHVATIQVVFLDGEESVPYGWDKDRALFGSQRFVQRYQRDRLDLGGGSRIRGLVLLDMVGAKDLQIDKETYSDRKLQRVIHRAARACGHQRYFFQEDLAVTDDHVPFLDAGIPAVDLIDIENNPQWHTKEDTLEHISADSLQIVAEVVLTALPGLEEHLFPELFPRQR